MKPNVEAFLDAATCTLTCVVWVPATRDAVIVDPVLDYDRAASRVSYLIGGRAVHRQRPVQPDFGAGRCDFPAGSAETLYDSILGRLYPFADSTRVCVGHDYQPNGRKRAWESTIGEEKRANVQLRVDASRADFARMRTERDAGLPAPRLLRPSVQVNIDAGRMPRPKRNCTSYLKIPLRR